MVLKNFRESNPITYVLSKILDSCDIPFDINNGIIYQPSKPSEPVMDGYNRILVLDVFDEKSKPNKKQYSIFNPLIKIDHGQILAFLILISNIISDPEITEDELNKMDLIFEHMENNDDTITYFIKSSDNETVLGVGTHMNQQYALFMACLNYAYRGGGLTEKDINIMTNIINEDYNKKYSNVDIGTKIVKDVVDTVEPDASLKKDQSDDVPLYIQNMDIPIGSYFNNSGSRYTNSYRYDPNVSSSMKNDIGIKELINRLFE